MNVAKLFSKNSAVYTLLIFLCLLAYGNTLRNQFTVVDDLATFVNSETVHNFGMALKSLNIENIIYAVFYKLFGVNPVPIHIMSISLHIANSILLFTIIKNLFNRKTAIIAAILFTVHPINTEAVTWISGNPYLMITFCFHLALLLYIKFKKTQKKSYLYTAVGVLFGSIVLLQAIWLVTIPVVIFIVEQFILEKKFDVKVSQPLLYFFIPMIVFGVVFVGLKGGARLSTRAVEHPMNQQTLKPVIEGVPYTVFTMARLYLFPKDLMIYYDGNPVTTPYYVSMYIATAIYGVLILYLWKKNRAYSGLLIILLVFLAPTYSPVKVAWFLSERYLYYGTGFFTTILAGILLYAAHKFRQPLIAPIIVILLICLYVPRTFARNSEFRNTQTLAIATMRTSPHSIRGYDDIGGDYLLKGDYKSALPYFRKTLTILPDSNTAVSNLGYIYILYGYPQTENDLTEKKPVDNLIKLGSEYFKAEQYTNSFYYVYNATLKDPSRAEPYNIMGDIYMKTNQIEKAKKMYSKVITEHPEEFLVYNKLAFIAFQEKNYDLAEKYLNDVLKRDPKNQNVIDNLKLIEQTKNQIVR